MTKLLILSSDTGEGHNSAAAAIENAARSSGFEARIRKPIEDSTRINRSLGDLYNFLLTHRPQWMGAYFKIINALRPNERDFFFKKVRQYTADFIASEAPDIILSVHPMMNHFVPRLIKEEGLGIPCFTFLTDPFPPFWRGWSSPYVDRYFVPTDEALQALTATGVAAWRIERVSMPVRPCFTPATATQIREVRDSLSFDDRPMILINGGARGGGPLLEIYRTIRRASSEANVLLICGRNQRLRSRIEKMGDARTLAVGFVADIHRYVAAADIVVTKPGALSTYEALACGVPVLLTGLRGLMPQESGLFAAANHYDFGYGVRSVGELENVIRKGPGAWRRKRESIPQFYSPASACDWIERIQPVNA